MKVAICLAGYFNSLKDQTSKGIDGFDHLKRHVISKVDQVDVYIHSWDLENREKIINCYAPWIKSCKFEEQKIFDSTTEVNPGYQSLHSIKSQFYSVSESFRLIPLAKFETYDWIIKSRFDIGRINRNSAGPHNLQNPYPVQCINFDPNLPKDKFYLANWKYFDTEGPPDMWFYGDPSSMKHFRFLDDCMLDMLKNPQYINWCGDKDGGVYSPIKGYKFFLGFTGLWDKKHPLETTWE
jgi:hypothetical protein